MIWKLDPEEVPNFTEHQTAFTQFYRREDCVSQTTIEGMTVVGGYVIWKVNAEDNWDRSRRPMGVLTMRSYPGIQESLGQTLDEIGTICYVVNEDTIATMA